MAPNLAIGNIRVNGNSVDTSPFSVLAGEQLNVEWTVTNIGDELISGSSQGFTSTASVNIDAVYLSDDDVFDPGDVQVGAYNNTAGLAPNGSYNGNASFSLFANTSASQYPLNKYLIFATNTTGSVAESDADNLVSVPVTVNAIDLSLDSATVAVGNPPTPESAAFALAASDVGAGYGSPTITAGQYIDVSWNVSNLGNQAAGSHFDGVYLSQDAVLDESDRFLVGIGPFAGSSNTYSLNANSVYVPIDTSIVGQAYVLFVTDDNRQIAESNENNNVYAVSVNVSTDLPDLTFSAVTVPADINAGQPISVSWTVTNQGTGSTSPFGWNDRVYLSDDTILGAEDVQVGSRFHFGQVSAGSSYSTGDVLLDLPVNAIGTRYLLFATDTDGFGGEGLGLVAAAAPSLGRNALFGRGSVLESNENNNVAFQEIIIKAADLTPSNVVSSTPTVEFGTAFNVTWTTSNVGNGNTFNALNNQIFLSADSIAGNSDDILIFNGTSNDLIAAGNTDTKTASITINSGGLLSNPLATDVDGYVLETENNDTQATANDLQQNFVLGAGVSNYVVRAKGVIEASRAGDYYRINASPGDTLTINQNASLSVNGVAAIGDSLLFLYDRNGALLQADDDSGPGFSSFIQYTLPANAYAGDYYIRAAGFGGSTGGYGLTIEQRTNSPLFGLGGNGVAPGDYYLVAKVDSGNAVRESNETNNFAISTSRINIAVPANSPDLTIVGSGPATALFGSTIPISWTVTNSSSNPAPSGWYDYVYFSDDNVISADDTVVSSFARGVSEPALAAGESYTVNRNITLPSGVIGNKFLLFATDRANNRPETNENNNLSTTAIQLVAPDLSVGAISTLPETISGQPLSVSWTVNNQGNGAASGTWTDYVYVSSDNEIGDDILLAAYSYTGSIAAGSSIVRTENIALPLSFTGSYQLVVRTDISSQLPESNEANNASIDDQSVLVRLAPIPNLTVASVTAPPTAFSSQSTVVSWSVTNTGTGATNAPNWYDGVYLSLDDTIDSTDVFLGTVLNPSYLNVGDSYNSSLTVTLPQGISGNYKFLVQTDIYNYVNELSNEGDNLGVGATTVVTLTPPPDLQVATVTAPNTAFSGQAVNLSWTVTNQGSGRTLETGWSDRVFLSADATLDAGDTFLTDVYHSGSLNAGGSYTGNTSVTLPIGVTGNYYFFVQSDIYNQVYENIYEGNNAGYRTTPTAISLTPPPDLVVASVTAPNTARSGESLTINYRVANDGFTATPNSYWNDTFYLSTDNQFDAATDLRLGTVARYGAVNAGDAYNQTASFNLSNTLGGDYYVFGVTDSSGVVFELDDTNNVTRSSNRVQITSQPADLVVSNTVVPLTGEAGKAVQVQWTVTNQGTGNSIITGWNDRVIASVDGTLGNGDDVFLGDFFHSGLLAANGSYSRTENIVLPFILAGNYQIFVTTDTSNNVYESTNEANNASGGSPLAISRQTPDLQVTAATGSATATSGQLATFNWTVGNFGAGTTNSNYWYDRLFLSLDNTISSDDILLGDVYHAGALDPNETYNGSATYTLPIDLTGNYRLLVSTDSTNNVLEAVETNNLLASTAIPVALSATPDLIVQSVDAPTQAIAGQGLSLTWTVANNGAANANQVWYDSVYLSLDPSFDRNSDIYLGYQAHTGGLNAGGTYTTTQTFNVPRGLGGRYFAFVVTDSANSVYERLGETNNTNYDGLSTEVIIPPPSDLVVTGVTVPTTGVIGQPVTISYTVQNQGTSTASGSWNDALYLSTDAVWDINDVSIGQVSHIGDVASNESYTGSLTTVLPGVSAGNYHVVVRSDIRNQVIETNDVNNANASINTIALDVEALTLGTPDNDSLRQGQSIYYRFDAVAGQAVRLRLDSSQNQSANELYVRFGTAPTRGQFDLTTNQPFNADPEIIVPIERTGTYYVLAYGDQVSGAAPYSIVAEDIPFSLTGVQTNKIGNLGESTLEVRGAKFSNDTRFELVGADGHVLQSSNVLFKNSTLAYVTFNLVNDALGAYDVRAVAGGDTAVLNDVVTVEASKAYDVDSSITGINEVRPSRNYQFDVNYLNKGNSDSIAPLLIVENNSGTNIGTTIGNVAVRSSLQLLGISGDGASQIIRPGDLNSLPVYFNTNTNGVDFRVRTYLADNTTAIDWNTFGESIRPTNLSSTQWNNFISNIAPVVTTYGAYVRMVNDIYQQISPTGAPIYDVQQLFSRLYTISPNYRPFTWPGVTLPQPPVPGVPDVDNDNDRNNGNDSYKPLVRRSQDPNDILGPKGFGESNWIDTDEPLKYTIRFENAATATAPAQQVVITQQLDADLDYRTFRIDDYGWSGVVYDVNTNQPTYRAQIDLTATRGILVNVEATISVTGLATWRISSIDPATGEPPLNAQSGFLPIDDNNGLGEGFVSYTIRANTNRQPAQTGAVIEARAEIVFDTEAPIATPVISNTLDVSKPISSVLPLATSSENPEFLVKWSGTDEGSALASYTIYVSDNNGAYTAWLTDTSLTESTYRGVAGHSYQFYSVATDNAGNSQVVPTTAQATIQVAVANVAPTAVTLANVVSSLAENTSTIDRVKVADINVTDDGLGTNTLSLNGADASSFEIFGGDLYIKAGTVLDFEPKSSYAVTVNVDDPSVGATPDASIDFSLTLTDVVEVITGTSTDPETLIGGQGADSLSGGVGSDYLNGGAGNDYLDGGVGNDVLDGSGDSAGLDTFAGGAGEDVYGVYNSATVIIEEAGDGIDTVWTAVNFTLSPNVENLYLVGNINGTGNASNNIIVGYGVGNNIINGGGGNDIIYGGEGEDRLFGESDADYLNGGAGNDYLDGGAGNDVLDGSGGNGLDTFAGGTGEDVYGVYNSDTVIIEEAGAGIDTVWTAVNYALAANVENLYLVGDTNGTGNATDNIIIGYGVGNNVINGGGGNDLIYGGEGDDRLFGESDADYLNGGAGNDYLDGGAGNDVLDGSVDSTGLDTFAGGAGDDVYGVYNSATVIIEEAGAGIDTVWTAVNFALAANVENLYLVGDISGTGNASDNTIIGYGVGDNVIDGGDGIDNLFGGAGNDTFILSKTSADNIGDFGVGNDRLQISASAFGGGLVAGVALQTNQIRVGANTADTADQRFIFDTTNGDLFFDADGSSAAAIAVKIANLARTSNVNASSFVIV